MYQALYRKYRPKTFDEVIGQEHITTTLTHQIESGNISHAYLFTGSRGTGKTSTAKIFAKAINCLNPINGSPCGDCRVCKALSQENNLDIVEIDAASNNRVDEVRDIREKVKFLPVEAKYKVYIIDEVHMLTESAFNALLKTLEEPPSHIVFILATTDVQKLPTTIISRCMRFDFHLLSDLTLKKHLKHIFSLENIECEDDALTQIVKSAQGSVRDMLSIADGIVAFSNGKIKSEDVSKILGTTDYDTNLKIIESISEKNIGIALSLLDGVEKSGKNMNVVAKDLTQCVRDLIVAKTCPDAKDMLSFTQEIFEKYTDVCSKIDLDKLLQFMKIFSSMITELKFALSPKTLLESAIIDCTLNEKKNWILKTTLKNKPCKTQNLCRHNHFGEKLYYIFVSIMIEFFMLCAEIFEMWNLTKMNL